MEYGIKNRNKKADKIKGFLYTIVNPETGGISYSTDFEYTEKKALDGYNVFCRMYVCPDITIMCNNGGC